MSVLSLFSDLTDPRVARTRRYPLSDLVIITLCGLLSGADNIVAICRWANVRKDWLQEQFGITAFPSHDTLSRVFAKIDPKAFADCLAKWSQPLWEAEKQPGDVVAFDGKQLNGTKTTGVLNIMSAWASRTQMVLAFTPSGVAGAEQKAMRELLDLVDVKGCLVTADAMKG